MDINLRSLYETADTLAVIVNGIDSQIENLEKDDPKRETLLEHRRKKYAEYLDLQEEIRRYLSGE